ncbi:MAG: hypothetical protein WA061_01170 [Microgenomates group bacterium]
MVKTIVISVLSTLFIVGLIGGAFYLGKQSSSQVKQGISSPSSMKAITPPTQEKKESEVSLFSGKVKKISSDLKLFKITDIDKENDIPESIVYYEAGVFTRGDLNGYTRILAIRPSEGPGPSIQYILATKDYKSYVLDDPINATKNYPEDDWDNPYMYLDKSKISKTLTFDSDHTSTISLTKPFALIKQDSVLLENKKTGAKDKYGNDIYIKTPITEYEPSLLLSSFSSDSVFYAMGTDWGTGEGYNAKEKKILELRKKYLHMTTLVHIPDSTGLTYPYILATQDDIDTYAKKLAAFEPELIAFKKEVSLYNQKKRAEYPPSPKYIPFPGLKVAKSAINLPDDFYNTYESAFPGACGGNTDTFIVDSIVDSDLEQVTSSSVIPLFVLKNNKHSVYEIAYNAKVGTDETNFKLANEGKPMPTFESYVAKHPLLFFKDAWGRWGVLGEYDIQLMGGCGKPVVYLYPEKPTNIHLSFTTPISLDTNIPAYKNGWFVQAAPNGTLTDLQPQYTDCDEIDITKFGSEYALNACKDNSYPYIYWSGKSLTHSYPTIDGGWVISKNQISLFLSDKLAQMGLNEKEIRDMTEYWVPEMNKKNTPYYRISFIQTKEMNDFIPMDVNPKPDSIIRVFLDYKALNTKPIQELKPQNLVRFERKGFTLVEWGGLK